MKSPVTTAPLENRTAQTVPHRAHSVGMVAQDVAGNDFNQTLLARLEDAESEATGACTGTAVAEKRTDTLSTTETPLPPESITPGDAPCPGQNPPLAYTLHGAIAGGLGNRQSPIPPDGSIGNTAAAAAHADTVSLSPRSPATWESACGTTTGPESGAAPSTSDRLLNPFISTSTGTKSGASAANASTQALPAGPVPGVAGEITAGKEGICAGQREAFTPSPVQNETLSGLSYTVSTVPSPGADQAPVHHATLRSHPDHATFHPELAAEVRVLVKDGLQHAQLQLHPTELGPIHIDIRVENQIADIRFSVTHATTRESISQSMEQLRNMLASEGLGLGQTHVGTGSHHQNPAHGSHTEPARTMAAHLAAEGAPPHATGMPQLVAAMRGVLDVYA
ncbi:MAG TPA: flagellar hook-length control protein FliK [Burkholderiaceae bacterium]